MTPGASVVARILGAVLVVIGVLGLMWHEIPYAEHRQETDIGPIAVHTSEKKAVPVPMFVAIAALVTGTAIIVADVGRSARRATT